MHAIRVVFADAQLLFLDGIQALLNSMDDIEVIALASDGMSAVRASRRLAPSIAVLNVDLPRLNGPDACAEIRSHSRNVQVVLLTDRNEPPILSTMVRCGARGLISKTCAATELVEAVRVAYRGGLYVHGHPSESLDLRASLQDDLSTNALTRRERQVVQLIAEGSTSKQIASTLGVSTKTAEHHRERIMRKLDLHSVALLTRYAVRTGIVSP